MAKIGIICGLKSEAKAVRKAFPDERVSIAISGANADRAYALAKGFADEGNAAGEGGRLIISVGVSGGLLPAYAPGDLVIGSKVVTISGEEYHCSSDYIDLLKRSHKAAGISPSIIYGSDEVILTIEEKNRLYQETGAKSVDMESHGAARAAKEAGLGFLAIRAIADPAGRALPEAALNAVNEDGSTKIVGTLFKAMQNPIQLSELAQLGSDSKEALKTLSVSLGGFLGVLLLGSDLG